MIASGCECGQVVGTGGLLNGRVVERAGCLCGRVVERADCKYGRVVVRVNCWCEQWMQTLSVEATEKALTPENRQLILFRAFACVFAEFVV